MVQLVNSQGLCDQIAKKFVGSNQQLDQHGRYYNNLGKMLCLGNEIFKCQLRLLKVKGGGYHSKHRPVPLKFQVIQILQH